MTATAAAAITGTHTYNEVWSVRVALAGIVAIPLAFACHGLARFGRRMPMLIGGAAALTVLVAVWTALPSRPFVGHETFVWPYMLSLIAAILTPFLRPGAHVGPFLRRFFEQTSLWGVLCVCAVAGVQLVAWAIRALFDLRTEHLGIDASIAVVGCILLIYLHRLRLDDAPASGRVPELWRRLATMIGAPFVSAMLAILTVYELAALLRGELPRNMLSPLILAAGVVGFLSALILSAVLDEGSGRALLPADPHRWARRCSIRLTRAFPVVLLLLLPMAWWALAIRIADHGVTPFRAVRAMGLLCLTALSVLGAWRWLRGRVALSWEVPAAVAGFAIIAAFGPASAVQLTIRSQSARLERMLAEFEATWPAGRTPSRGEIALEPARYDALHDALRVLIAVGGGSELRRALASSRLTCTWSEELCPERLAVYRRGSQIPDAGDVRVLDVPAGTRFATLAGEIASVDESHSRGDVRSSQRNAPHTLWLDADRVVAHDGAAVQAEASLRELLARVHRDLEKRELALPVTTLALRRADGSIAADLAIERLSVWVSRDEPLQAVRLIGIITWR